MHQRLVVSCGAEGELQSDPVSLIALARRAMDKVRSPGSAAPPEPESDLEEDELDEPMTEKEEAVERADGQLVQDRKQDS